MFNPICFSRAVYRSIRYWALISGCDYVTDETPTPKNIHILRCRVCGNTSIAWSWSSLERDSQEQTTIDAARYNFLRERDLDTITKGGVFAGMTPRNVVLNGADLDAAVDAAMLKTPNVGGNRPPRTDDGQE